MLRELHLADFKSYKNATLKLAPLSIMIGTNASGKSNAIEAMRLLSWLAQGNRLNTIRFAVYEGHEAVRGRTTNLGYFGCTSFILGATTDANLYENFTVTLELDDEDELRIQYEKIFSSHRKVPLYEVVGRSQGVGSDLRVAYDNFARGGHKPQVPCTDQMAILSQLQSSARFESGHKTTQRIVPETCSEFQKTLSRILFLDPQPSLMRSYSFTAEQSLLGDGSNISGVLYNLCENELLKDHILDIICSLPEQDIADISFISTPRQEVMLEITETFGGKSRKFDATTLSDGTLRVLSIAAAVLSAPPGSMIVIEEVDNGVHPSRARLVLTHILELAKQRNLHVLLTSHNPALLDALPDEAVPHVVLCFRDPKNGDSKLVQLQDLNRFPSLVAQGSIGQLMTRGTLERFIKMDRENKDKRKEQFRSWLKSLPAD
jgi:predicted ATPase